MSDESKVVSIDGDQPAPAGDSRIIATCRLCKALIAGRRRPKGDIPAGVSAEDLPRLGFAQAFGTHVARDHPQEYQQLASNVALAGALTGQVAAWLVLNGAMSSDAAYNAWRERDRALILEGLDHLRAMIAPAQ